MLDKLISVEYVPSNSSVVIEIEAAGFEVEFELPLRDAERLADLIREETAYADRS